VFALIAPINMAHRKPLASSLVINACPTLATCQYGPITVHRFNHSSSSIVLTVKYKKA